MPVGIQRLNAKKSQPNTRIIFIKPLKGPDEAIAQDFLERIAAQCREWQALVSSRVEDSIVMATNTVHATPAVPIMKEHTLSVMTLEEYEPNQADHLKQILWLAAYSIP